MQKITLTYLTLVLAFSACLNSSEYNALVPATVDQNSDLPSLTIEVAGRERMVHFRTFGEPEKPVMFVLHGSMSDMRAFLPFEIFSDKYYVVMWDLRGNGLSERCTAEELKIDEMVNEIRAMKTLFSPEWPVTIVAHSWAGLFTARYMARYPAEVKQAVLIEPYMLSGEIADSADVELDLFTGGFIDAVYQADFFSAKDHETLDFRGLGVLNAGVTNFYCDPNNLPEWPVWRVGVYAVICWENEIMNGTTFNYDFTEGLSDYWRKVLIVGGSCSPIGYEFQEKYHQALFRDAEVLRIENAGHRIPTEQFYDLVRGMKNYLKDYQE